ncbi:MAG: glycosyltransferase [Proteobacteria bacterium]|nr:glycosyltransferase [Pseudomonadota bacterium]MBU4259065.1 glycosyltransferase [Pseudomonadota bacterium]MBU4286601.1 glycosyltransferase [Pseudomonadota bacterium]MBU4414231.1 glycosyltransferase [Pseudomonadota bacterium]MCG2758017.1 glycosyltransferase [Desulfobacteraceae bacterium]
MSRRLKILISAYACSPVRGSEPGMGWGFISALAQFHDLWVITEKEKFQKEVEEGLKDNPELAKHVRFFFIQKKRHRTLRKIWPPSYYWFYKSWQREAFTLARNLHKEIVFDVVHQLNMVGFREPGYLWRLDTPFVWGPIGGFVQMPLRFSPLLGCYGSLYYLGRNFLNWLQIKTLSRTHKAAARAGTGLIAATSDTAKSIQKFWQKDSHIICEVGLSATKTTSFSKREDNEPLRLVWSGLHIPLKGLPILLKALVFIPSSINWRLDILGEGRETGRWKQMAMKLGIAERCNWHGWVPRDESLKTMRHGHVFVVSSLQDLTSTVILEALALGLPVICLDHCGFADVVTPECGIKVPVTYPKKVIEDMSLAIQRIADNESLRQQMAAAALNRAAEFSWDNKAKKLNEIYRQVMEEWSH